MEAFLRLVGRIGDGETRASPQAEDAGLVHRKSIPGDGRECGENNVRAE